MSEVNDSLPDKYNNPIKDKTNPRSVINITPSTLSTKIAVIPDSIFEMGEDELRIASRATLIDEQLRISFWREYNSAQDNEKMINLSNVYGPVCSQSHFIKRIITNSHKIAFMLTPPQDYKLRLESMLDFGFAQYEEILRLSNTDAKGNPNTKLIAEKHKIIDTIHQRVMGAIPHRIDTRNVNLNQELPPQVSSTPITDPKLLDQQLAELKQIVSGVTDEPKEVFETESIESN